MWTMSSRTAVIQRCILYREMEEKIETTGEFKSFWSVSEGFFVAVKAFRGILWQKCIGAIAIALGSGIHVFL